MNQEHTTSITSLEAAKPPQPLLSFIATDGSTPSSLSVSLLQCDLPPAALLPFPLIKNQMVFPDLCIWNCVQSEELSDPQEQTITSPTYIVMCLKLLANNPFNGTPPALLHHGNCFLPEGQSLDVEEAYTTLSKWTGERTPVNHM